MLEKEGGREPRRKEEGAKCGNEKFALIRVFRHLYDTKPIRRAVAGIRLQCTRAAYFQYVLARRQRRGPIVLNIESIILRHRAYPVSTESVTQDSRRSSQSGDLGRVFRKLEQPYDRYTKVSTMLIASEAFRRYRSTASCQRNRKLDKDAVSN